MNSLVPDLEYRCPNELAVTAFVPKRVAVIGQCLVESWPRVLERLVPGCKCDFFLFNNAQELPVDQQASGYDFQLVHIPLRSIVPDWNYFRLSCVDSRAYEELFEMSSDRLRQFLRLAMKWNIEHGVLAFVANFLVPQQNPLGRLLPRYDLRNFVYFVERLNQVLDEEIRTYSNAYLFDYDQIAATFGRKYFQDDTVLQLNHNSGLADSSYDLDYKRLEVLGKVSDVYELDLYRFAELGWSELLGLYRTVNQVDAVKLVICDIDDTLWRGVAAERTEPLPEHTEGWPLGIVEALGYLKRRGLLLALVSKNNSNFIESIWGKVFWGRLLLDDFAVRKINWDGKHENIDQILNETNLLSKNVLFVDDNPVERAAVKSAFPDMRVVGPNPYLWRRILLWSPETQVATITAESSVRTEMVQGQVEREVQRERLSREEFLTSLNLEVRVHEVGATDDPRYSRAFELVNKTNQFNTTGRQWTRQQWDSSIGQSLCLFIFDAQDRYTNYGTIGAILMKDRTVVQFVMSCRVVGLEVEIAALAALPDIETAELVETPMNLLCRDLWKKAGFILDQGIWRRQHIVPMPPHIALNKDKVDLDKAGREHALAN